MIDHRAASALLGRSPYGVVVQADDGRVVEHNDAACELLEMTSDQLLGRSSVSPEWRAVTADLEPLDGSDHPAMRSLRSGEVVRGAVMGVRSGAGRYRWLRVDSVPFDVDGAQWVVSNFVDVTAELESLTQLTAAIDRLQAHVAPGELPQIAGVLAEGRYRPVVSGLKIGGDVCDVVSIGPGRLGFFVGDVAGHDLDTIATTTVAHHTLRSAARNLRQPDRMLVWLDATLEATPGTRFCSAIAGKVTVRDDAVIVRFANAGHVRPLVVRHDGVEVLDDAGTIAGASVFQTPPVVEVELSEGESLLFTTDGLLENLDPRLEREDLVERLRDLDPPTPDAVMAVVDDLLDRAGDDPVDDTAVLMISAVGRA